jgi:hypothetical protein
MTNQWISHVKHYAAQHGCTYPEALKRAKSSYQSTAKPRRKSIKGKGMWDWADPNKNGTTQFFTHDLPSGLVHQGIPAVGATLGGIAGAELGPVGSMAGAYAGRKAGEATANKINELYGIGLYSDMKKAGKAALKKQISHYAPVVGQNLARAGADYIGIPSGIAGLGGHYAGQYVANKLNSAIGEGVRRKRRSKGKGFFEDLKSGYSYANDNYNRIPELEDNLKNRYPSEYRTVKDVLQGRGRPRKMKGGDFWNSAGHYLQPVGDAAINKSIEKINGLGMKRRSRKMKGGDFWNSAGHYLQPVGDAAINKSIEKINGLGLKKRVHRKKRGGALYAAGYGSP